MLRRSVAALAVGLLVSGFAVTPALADDPAFTISDERISGPTGMATDTATSTYWVVNTGGARMFALSRTGQVKGTVDFRAEPANVEAASYRSGRLYVGDIGDPARNREIVSIYQFPNLTPSSGTVTYQSWDVRYPDGPHDAKAMLVDASGRLFIVTTGEDPGIYAAPTAPTRSGVNQLERVADAPAGVTDAVALSASRWALRTATSVQEIDAESYKRVAETTLPIKDGDTLGVDLADAEGLVAGSAGASASMYAVVAPSAAPTGQSTPGQAPSAKATPSATAGGAGQEPSADSASDSSRSGTWMAIGLAALLAVLAGLVAYLWPSRRAGATRPVRPPQPPQPSRLPPAERPVTSSRATRVARRSGTGASAYRPARALVDSDRPRPPGDIEDDDDLLDDTTVRADQLPGRRAGAPPPAGAEAPRRSLGYDPGLWGESALRRRPTDDPG